MYEFAIYDRQHSKARTVVGWVVLPVVHVIAIRLGQRAAVDTPAGSSIVGQDRCLQPVQVTSAHRHPTVQRVVPRGVGAVSKPVLNHQVLVDEQADSEVPTVEVIS